MKSPRIYTYKVTFEEIPHWYWGAHKEKRFGEIYLGSPVTHKWMWEFYTPKIQILEFFPYSDKGWKEASAVEERIIKPDLNNLFCLNEGCGGFASLAILRKSSKKMHEVKNEEGKSVKAIEMVKIVHLAKNEEGKSVNAVKAAKKLHEEKDDEGRSVATMRIHKEKTKDGKSKHAMKNLESINSQKWKCLVTGHISTPGGLSRWQNVRGIDLKKRVQITRQHGLTGEI